MSVQVKRALIWVCILVSAALLAVQMVAGTRWWECVAPMAAIVTGTLFLRSTRSRS